MKEPVPWMMCRSCHRLGRTEGCKHPLGNRGTCGQCGQYRKLVTCHAYDFRRIRELRYEPTPKRNGPDEWRPMTWQGRDKDGSFWEAWEI